MSFRCVFTTFKCIFHVLSSCACFKNILLIPQEQIHFPPTLLTPEHTLLFSKQDVTSRGPTNTSEGFYFSCPIVLPLSASSHSIPPFPSFLPPHQLFSLYLPLHLYFPFLPSLTLPASAWWGRYGQALQCWPLGQVQLGDEESTRTGGGISFPPVSLYTHCFLRASMV